MPIGPLLDNPCPCLILLRVLGSTAGEFSRFDANIHTCHLLANPIAAPNVVLSARSPRAVTPDIMARHERGPAFYRLPKIQSSEFSFREVDDLDTSRSVLKEMIAGNPWTFAPQCI